MSNSTEFKICLGKILLKINTIIEDYMCIRSIIDKAIIKITGIENRLNNLNSSNPNNPITDDLMNDYFIIVKKLKCKIDDILNKRNIPCDEEILGVDCNCNCNNIIDFKLYPFLSMYFLQETSCDHEYLFFVTDPSTISYDRNTKTIIEDICEGSILYPVWYYVFNNKISQNYTFMIDLIGSITYTELLDYRVLLKDGISMHNKKSMEAIGKYKFSYMKHDITIILPDPFNPSFNISPKQQGVIDGLYSFAESLDIYVTVAQGIVAVSNTLVVLNKLSSTLLDFARNIDDTKEKLCCTC